MSLVSRALVFATLHHQHQLRKGSRIPYMSHLLNACRILAEKNCSDELLAAALLHDVVEDTDVTIEEVEANFGPKVADLVRGATELDKLEKKAIEKESSWEKRKFHTVQFLQNEATTDQLLVSGADKLDSLRSMVGDHSRMGDELWKRFNASREKQAWYYSSLADVLSEKGKDNEIIAEMAREMRIQIQKLFE